MNNSMIGLHQEELRLFYEGRAGESIGYFEAALKERETSIGWNDWATAALAGQSALCLSGIQK